MSELAPTVLVGRDGADVRISITCPSEGEAQAVIDFIMDSLRIHGRVNIPITGTPDDVIESQVRPS